MSFENMTVMELKKVARLTAVDLGTAKKRVDIIKVLHENGVTYDYYISSFPSERPEPIKPEPSIEDLEAPPPTVEQKVHVNDVTKAKKVIVKLSSGWSVLETDFGRVTQASPFLLVDSEQLPDVLATGDFRVATPEEVAEAYGLNKK